MTLRPATPDDLAQVLGWIADADALKRWGGPKLAYPPEPDCIWADLHANPAATYALSDDHDHLVGFGQVIDANERHPAHLARIIIHPGYRGAGLGAALMRRLIDATLAERRPARFTLNVYPDNLPARRLYAGLGFTDSAYDAERGFILMELTPSDELIRGEPEPDRV